MRYSKRLSWPVHLNALATRVHAARQNGSYFLDLTCSNPTEVFEDYPHAAIADALRNIRSFRYEPDPLGTQEARTAIQQYYGHRGIQISPERLLFTASTSEAYALLFKLLCDPDDEILVPAPSYPLFEYLANLESVRVSHYQLQFDGMWFFDFGSIERSITPRTRAIVVVNPNNPTGSFLKQAEFDRLLGLVRERNLPIISDEVFLDYARQPNAMRVRTFVEQSEVVSFSLNGLSKSAGMPQMKLGWVVIGGPEDGAREARERLALIADTYLSVATPVQAALPMLLEIGADIRHAIQERIEVNWGMLERTLSDGPAHALRCEGGWSAIVRLPATETEESWILRLWEECGILVQPGYFFDMAAEPYFVVSLISVPGEFEKGISRVHQIAMRA
ncbi:MAG TPA: pyridoxal phosphate-dependent aminotransferase [Bryobacteraceae bacterium]|nr:pyridoxal phosphate-dependent aminotransferase [Bryobacteraceae bacterium]